MTGRKSLLLLLAAALAAGACASRAPAPATVVVELPTSAPSASPTRPATATPAPSPEGLGGGGEGEFVALVNYTFIPPKIMLAHPITGEALAVFDAPGLSPLSSPEVGGGSVFYLDEQTSVLKRVSADGVIAELPFVNSGTEFFEGDFLPSPDGARIAWGTNTFQPAAGNATRISLHIADADGSNAQTILDEILQDDSILPLPLQWASDGATLYFTNIPYGIGGYILFAGGPDLAMVDTRSGAVVPILPNSGCLCAMAVAPDGATVATIAGIEPLELVLHDIASGVERRAAIDQDFRQAGNIVWAPDGSALLYTMALSTFDDPEAERFAIVRLDVATLEQAVVLPSDAALYRSMAWPADSVAWVNDKNGNSWLLDVETGALTQVADGFAVVD